MKIKLFTLGVLSLLFMSCATPLTAVKDPSLRPFQYQNPLFVIEHFESGQSTFQKFFNDKINAYELIDHNNQEISQLLQSTFAKNQKKITFHNLTKNIDQDLVLNPQNQINTENESIVNAIRTHQADLVITIYAQDIHRIYNSPNTNVGVQVGLGHPNVNLGVNSATSSSLSYTYIITAVDPNTNLEVWKGKYVINNAHTLFNSIPKNFCKQLVTQLNKDQLF